MPMILHPYTELLTSNLRLSPITSSDLPGLQAIWSDPLVTRYLPGGEPYSSEIVQGEIQNILAHWQNQYLGIFAIRWHDQNDLLGYCGIQKLHSGPAGVSPEALQRWGSEYEILYGLSQNAWGRGIASEAAYACLRYAFEVLGLDRVVAGIHPDNLASGSILTHKLGMTAAPEYSFYGECPHFVIHCQDHSPEKMPLFNLSTDPARLDLDAIAAFLGQAYWAHTRSRDTIKRSLQGSLNFGIYDRCKQTGFGRVISDCATLAWLCDVFIDETYRGLGLGKWLVSATLAHPDLQGMRRWLLATRDAHGLYQQFGYQTLQSPERWMEKFNPDAT